MSVSVRIDEYLVEQVMAAAKAEFRTVQGQLEFWAKVGRALKGAAARAHQTNPGNQPAAPNA